MGVADSPHVAAADWYADPLGKHQHRYWDGTTWTDHVSDNGVQGLDPLPAGPSAAGSASTGQADAWLVKRTAQLGIADWFLAIEASYVEDNCKHRGWLVFRDERIVWLEKSMGSLRIPSSRLVNPEFYTNDDFRGLSNRLLGGLAMGIGRRSYSVSQAAAASFSQAFDTA